MSKVRSRLSSLAGGLAALTLLGAALAFAVADQTSRVASDLSQIQALEGAETDAALFRANLAIALAATTEGDPQTVTAAVTAAIGALDRIEIEALDGLALEADLTVLRDAALTIGNAADGNDPAAAAAVAIQTAGPALDRIARALGTSSANLRAAIEAEQEDAGRVARLSSFSAALLAPALILLSYRRSSRRRLERQSLEAELRRSNDLSRAKDELIAALSHQLRTPLTGIQGFTAALLDQATTGPLDPEQVTEFLRTVYDESLDLGRMIDDFLVVSRSAAGALSFVQEPVSIREALQPTMELFARTARRPIIDVTEASVGADPARLRHIVRNLLANAFSHGKGQVALRGVIEEDSYLLQVIDQGAGMTQEQVARAIEGFVHTPRETTVTGSLGLGLKAASTLAAGIGTRLEYRRVSNLTVFELRLALAEQPAPRQVTYSGIPG